MINTIYQQVKCLASHFGFKYNKMFLLGIITEKVYSMITNCLFFDGEGDVKQETFCSYILTYIFCYWTWYSDNNLGILGEIIIYYQFGLHVNSTLPCIGLLQIHMIISFPFLLAKDLRRYLLIMRTRSFFTLLYVGGTYAR